MIRASSPFDDEPKLEEEPPAEVPEELLELPPNVPPVEAPVLEIDGELADEPPVEDEAVAEEE